MAKYRLKLFKTYYRKGFFNVPVDFDRFVSREDGPIDIWIGGQLIQGSVNHSANLNGTARISGGSKLRDWFQRNFREGDYLTVQFQSPTMIKIAED